MKAPKEAPTMFEVYPTSWPASGGSSDPRNQFHERALNEARMVTDLRETKAPERTHSSLVSRLRLAIVGGTPITSTESCGCPA
jgi:hypothetical protein